MSPGRLIHISSGGETSPATVIVVVLIVAVLGYLVLEKGSGKPDTDSSRSRSDPAADPVHEVELIPIPDIIYTDYEPGTDSGDEAAAAGTEGGASKKKPNSETKTPGPGGLKSGKTRRLQGGESVGFTGADTESAASDMVGWDRNIAPEGSVYSRSAELEGHKDKWKKDEGPRPRIESRLPLFEKQLEEGGHIDLIQHMKRVELLVEEDYMRGGAFTGDQADRYQKAIADTWVSRWGKVPQSISYLVAVLIRTKIIDVSALAQGMMDDDDIKNSRAAPGAEIIEDLFTRKQCVAPRDDLTGKRERGQTWEEWVTKQPNDEAAILEFLLGWFVLSYRGYEREQWTDQRSRRDVGEGPKGSKSGRKHAGLVLCKSVETAVGPLGSEVLLWLSWAGRRYHVNRLFTPTGADLLDGTVRASILRLNDDSDDFFKMDITLFVPGSDELVSLDTAEVAAHWVRFTGEQDKTGRWNAYWVRDALIRAMFLAQTWIGLLDAQGKETQNSLCNDRILLRQLFLRPGFGRDHVQLSKGTTTRQAPVTLFKDQRTPVLMQLDPDEFTKAASQPSYLLHHAREAMRRIVELMRITTVRFVNLRQNNWYTPQEGGSVADQFDPRQVALMVGLLTSALSERLSSEFPLEMAADEFAIWKGAENDPHRPATQFDNTENATNPGRLPVSVDFGPILPYLPAPGRGVIQATFPCLKAFYRAKVLFIPLICPLSVAHRLVHAGAAPRGDRSVQSNTALWLADWGTEMFKSLEANPDKRIVLVTESSTEESLARVLYTPLDDAISSFFITRLVEQDPNIKHEQIIESVTTFLRILTSQVSITIIGDCQTDINQPRIWPLRYSTDFARKAKELVESHHEYAKDRAEGVPSERESRLDASAEDTAETDHVGEVEEAEARLLNDPYLRKKMEEARKAEKAKRERDEAIVTKENEEKQRLEKAQRKKDQESKALAKIKEFRRVREEEDKKKATEIKLKAEDAKREREAEMKANERKPPAGGETAGTSSRSRAEYRTPFGDEEKETAGPIDTSRHPSVDEVRDEAYGGTVRDPEYDPYRYDQKAGV